MAPWPRSNRRRRFLPPRRAARPGVVPSAKTAPGPDLRRPCPRHRRPAGPRRDVSAAGIVGSLDASHTACKVCAARSGGLPAVRSEAPERIVAILKSARSPAPDPRLTEVLEAFRSQWRAIARRKYPSLQAEIEDAIQNALLKL